MSGLTKLPSTTSTSTGSAASNLPSIPTSMGWSREQTTEEAVNQLMIQKFTEIVVSYDQRKQAASLQDLATGPWYPNDYAAALQKHEQGERLGWLKANNAFFHGFPPKGFAHLPSSSTLTRLDICSYQIKVDCLPSQALENVKTGQFSFMDCGSTVGLAMYETLKEVLGEARFNEIFSAQGQTPLKLNPDVLHTPLYTLGFVVGVAFDPQAIYPNLGDNVYFTNIPLYYTKHPHGEYKGFHAVCISPPDVVDKRYIAFGAPAGGVTERAMNDFMVEELNARPINPSLIFTELMADYFRKLREPQELQFAATMGINIADYKVNRDEFEQAVQQSAHEMAGLYYLVKRLDIDAIRKYMRPDV